MKPRVANWATAAPVPEKVCVAAAMAEVRKVAGWVAPPMVAT